MSCRHLATVLLMLMAGVVNAESSPPQNGLAGFYYGTADFSGPVRSTVDPQIAFDWQAGSPLSDLPADDFTVRWLGEFQAPISGDLTLILRSDDGIRVWVDDRLVINDWIARSPAESRHSFTANAGQWYRVRIDYFEAKGGATVGLSWEGSGLNKQTVPTTALRPLTQPAMARLPTASPISPVCITGVRRPDASVTAAVDGKSQRVLDLPETGFYFNAKLQSDRPVPVTAGSTTGSIAWTPTVLAGEHDLFLRVGDAILLTTPVALRYSITQESGVLQADRRLKVGAQQVETFKQPGSYRILAKNDAGQSVADFVVVAVAVDFDGPIANQVGHRREKGVEVTAGGRSAVVFTTSDESLLDVAFKEQTDYGARLYLTSRRRGTPTIVARLAGSGAIIGTQSIDEFTLSTPALAYAVRNAENDSATLQLVMSPWVPALTAQLRIFAHRSTFEGGGKALDVSTDDFSVFKDPVTGESCGQLDITLSIPEGENMYCLRLTMDQHSRHGTAVGATSLNGSACDFDVEALYIETGDTKTYPLIVKEGDKNPDAEHHGKRPSVDHKITMDPAAAKSVKFTADTTFNCIKQDNWKPKVRAEKNAKEGRYSVSIDGTAFPEKIIISSQCEFELSATVNKAEKPFLYRVFPGTSVTITATLKKRKKGNDSHTHPLTVSGPTATPPFEVTCPTEVGQSVSVTIDVYDRRLAAGDYSARILGASKDKIFTVTDRVTLNNHIDSLSGEMGSVNTGGSDLTSPASLNVRVNQSNGVYTTTITGSYTVTYTNDSSIVNDLSPGGSKEWPSSERDKAPSSELTGWASCVSHIQQHEQGHLDVWTQNQPARTESVTGSGTGATAGESNTAATAQHTANKNATAVRVAAEIKTGDTTRQNTYHGTPAGTVDLNQFKVPGHD